MTLRVDIRLAGRRAIATLDGELDLTDTQAVRDQLLDALPMDGDELVLDLNAVRYIDSSGLNMIFSIARELEVARQRLTLVVPEGSPLMRLLEISRMGDAVGIVHDLSRSTDERRFS